MDSTIRIYRTTWNDISLIKKLFNEHLLKYTVSDLREDLFSDIQKETPILEINGNYLYNPTISELKELLGLQDRFAITYVDTLVMGASIEALFFLDYAKKKGINAICFGKENEKELSYAYEWILRLPNPFIQNYIFDEAITSLRFIHNKRYIALQTAERLIYSRTAFIVFNSVHTFFQVSNEKILMDEFIFLEQKTLFKKMKEKRIRNKRKRQFALIGNHPNILEKTLEFMQALDEFSTILKYELLVLSDQNFRYADQYLLALLRKRKNIRIIGSVNIQGFDMQSSYEVTIHTNIIDYTAEYIYEYNKKTVLNNYVQGGLELDKEGYLETDHTYKTRNPNIYAMKKEDFELKDKSRIELLDKYIESAGALRQIQAYLDSH